MPNPELMWSGENKKYQDTHTKTDRATPNDQRSGARSFQRSEHLIGSLGDKAPGWENILTPGQMVDIVSHIQRASVTSKNKSTHQTRESSDHRERLWEPQTTSTWRAVP